MARFVLRRLLHVGAVLLLVSAGTLALMDLTPGGPAYAILGEDATREQVEATNERLGLDRPFLVRYGDWLSGAVRGDFGESYISKRPVADLVTQRMPVTLQLAALGLTAGLLISIPLAAFSAKKRDEPFDRMTSAATSVLISAPHFLTAVLLVYFLAVENRWFPVTGWRPISDGLGENLRYAFLPALTLALGEIPVFTRVLRADLVSTLQDDFIVSAQAKGVRERRVLFVHALRPSSFSLVTLAGLSLGGLIGGAVIVENIFALPGLGQLIVQSILNKDLPLVQGTVFVVAVGYVLINALIDLAYLALDPRVRIAAAR